MRDNIPYRGYGGKQNRLVRRTVPAVPIFSGVHRGRSRVWGRHSGSKRGQSCAQRSLYFVTSGIVRRLRRPTRDQLSPAETEPPRGDVHERLLASQLEAQPVLGILILPRPRRDQQGGTGGLAEARKDGANPQFPGFKMWRVAHRHVPGAMRSGTVQQTSGAWQKYSYRQWHGIIGAKNGQ